MRVTALFAKTAVGGPMIAVPALRGVAGQGLADDANAEPSSPRHVLIVGQGDLDELAITGVHLRANIVLDGDVKSLPSGTVLDAGMRLRITMFCEPCALLDRERPGLFKTVGARRGMLARVIGSGSVRVGDEAVVSDQRAVALPRDWKQRVRDIVAVIPAGESISYGQLATIAGVDRAYIRALPTVLRSLAVPAGRIVRASEATLPHWHAQAYFADATPSAERAVPSRSAPRGTAA